jgi:hypothetical protein
VSGGGGGARGGERRRWRVGTRPGKMCLGLDGREGRSTGRLLGWVFSSYCRKQGLLTDLNRWDGMGSEITLFISFFFII